MKGRLFSKVVPLLALAAAAWSAACSNDHNVNSAANLITVDGQVFLSRTQRVGVADVTVILEKSDVSTSKTVLPDIMVRTDANGRWEAKFSLGYTGAGVTDIAPVVLEESMRILMVSPETLTNDLGAGFTFQAGKTYHIWDVFLEDFAAGSSTAP
jgi:hypothetical protein